VFHSCSCAMDPAASLHPAAPSALEATASVVESPTAGSSSSTSSTSRGDVPASPGRSVPPVIEAKPTLAVAIKQEELMADTLHRRRVAITMHRLFHPNADAPPGGAAVRTRTVGPEGRGGAGTATGGAGRAGDWGAHGGDDPATSGPANSGGADDAAAADDVQDEADGGGVGSGGDKPAAAREAVVGQAISGFSFFAPTQVAEAVARVPCVGMEQHLQEALTRAIFLAADQDDVTGQLVLDSPAEDVMAVLLSTSRRTCRGTIPLGTRVRVLRFLRAMR